MVQPHNPAITAIIPTLSNQSGLSRLTAELKAAGIPAKVMDNTRHNYGFAAAVNRGAKDAESEWLLILNDDVEGITEEMVSGLRVNGLRNGWAAISPVLTKPDGTIENMGYRVLPAGKVELNFDSEKTSDKELDGITAACLLIKRDVFEHIGGFDSRFFAYLEDVDLCLRLKKAGYHFGIATDIQVTHHHLTTSKKKRGFKEKQDLVNWWRILFKHWPPSRWRQYFIPIMIERGRNVSGYFKALYA